MPDHKPQDHGPVYIHEDEMDWETLRYCEKEVSRW